MAERKWTKEVYDDYVKKVRSDLEADMGEITTEVAFDIAKSLIEVDPSLRKFIVQKLFVAPGCEAERLANDI
jgi:hypothetical protein